MTMGHSPSILPHSEEAIKDAQALRMSDLNKVLEEDTFHDCFTGVDNVVDLNDASTLFEEAQRLLSPVNINFHSCNFFFPPFF